ncbi:pentatricopeptide repeat-containing protein At1g11290, chloroplastic-like [Macadamia integrifolia]|uniref:pentatricopeptide repeat-containing protein At1g11290, chloroplastic-like n=1 Tax=Macadamia integrifolia TaxID=60698 RepID=UPI001C4F1A80|nr:pentatricopeptide repeat-containing protein At1g11290, chloroplastic-like [Macadamia integrifolia]
MFLRFPVYNLRRSLAVAAAISTNPSFSGAATNCGYTFTYPEINFISCNDQIACDVGKESSFEELELFARLLRNGSVPKPHYLSRVVSACANSSSLYVGEQVHSTIIKLGFDSNVFINSALVNMYGNFDCILSAQQMFDEMPERNVVSWNSLITAYLHAGFPHIAVEVSLEMLKLGLAPNPSTISALLVACSRVQEGELGIQVHALGLKSGISSNIFVGTGLIDMYSKCSNVDDAKRVFDHLPYRNTVTWTSMVTGYAQHQQSNEAMILTGEMRRLGVKLNSITYNSLLSSCSSPSDLDHGKQVHCQVIQQGLESSTYIVVSLMTMYSECGSLEEFCKMCPTMSTWDQIIWNSVIAGFSHLGKGEQALECFARMRKACIATDIFTFTSILRAIGILSAFEEGKLTHALILKSGYASHVNIQNGLVTMYARCGSIDDSKQVFSSMDQPDLVSWNSLLSGCAQHGYGMEAVDLFEHMRRTGIRPDHTTFLSVLSACSHVGLIDKGLECFDLMRCDNSVEAPRAEHYACIVDVLGRAGCLYEAEYFVNNMGIEPGPSAYKALLSACQVHGNVDIAMRSAKKLLELRPNDPATYVLLANILATGGCWEDATEMRRLMCERGVRKKPGYSWIEVNNQNYAPLLEGGAGDLSCTSVVEVVTQ